MAFYYADIEMLMSEWNTLYHMVQHHAILSRADVR
jgi:hypothetical protein